MELAEDNKPCCYKMNTSDAHGDSASHTVPTKCLEPNRFSIRFRDKFSTSTVSTLGTIRCQGSCRKQGRLTLGEAPFSIRVNPVLL